MPAGVDWPTYLKFTASALVTMLAGSQVVHMYYKPLDDIDKYILHERTHLEMERKRLQNKHVLPVEDMGASTSNTS